MICLGVWRGIERMGCRQCDGRGGRRRVVIIVVAVAFVFVAVVVVVMADVVEGLRECRVAWTRIEDGRALIWLGI